LPKELKLKPYDFARLEKQIVSDIKENETMEIRNEFLLTKCILI